MKFVTGFGKGVIQLKSTVDGREEGLCPLLAQGCAFPTRAGELTQDRPVKAGNPKTLSYLFIRRQLCGPQASLSCCSRCLCWHVISRRQGRQEKALRTQPRAKEPRSQVSW